MTLATSDRVAVNADVVGYSRLLADDFETTTTRMEQLRKFVSGEVEESAGLLVDFTGDNFMVLFDEPESAVKTAIAISSKVEDDNAEVAPNRQLKLRMGIDSGEIAEVDGKFFGDALNVAARIQAFAPEGGLSISDRVYRTLDEPSLRFQSRGRQSFKNIPEKVEVFEFKDLPRDGELTKRDSLALDSPTVAVLPIHTENAEGANAALAQVVRSDLIHRLSQVPHLVVVDTGRPDLDGPKQPVRYVLESGMHVLGETVLLYAELLEVATWNFVKAHKRSAPTAEIVRISEELAEDVARSIEVDLIVGAPAALYSELDDPIAIEKIYRGWYLLSEGTKQSVEQALELFAAVAESHPDQPYGFVLQAFTNWWGASTGVTEDTETVMEDAYEQAQTAKAIGDPTGMADMVIAAVLMSRRDYDRAVDVVGQTQISRSTCDASYGLHGSIRRFMGDWEQAIEATDTAMRLTVVNKPWYPTVKACSLLHGGRPDEALTLAEQVVAHQPNNLEALLILAAAQVETGLDRRAKATAQTIKERFPAVDISGWLDANPYRDREVIERWKGKLAEVGLV